MEVPPTISPEPKPPGFRRVLSNQNFAKLWSGQLISNLGDRFNYMALIALIIYEMNKSALDAGKIVIFMTLPILLFGPLAGAFVDRWSRKRTMVAADLLRGLLVALIPLANRLFEIYVIIFLVSTASRFFFPARSSIIANIVAKDELMVANSVSQSTFMLTMVVGPALGAALVALMGVHRVFYLDALSYLVSAVAISRISIVETHQKSGQKLASILEEMRNGLDFIRRNKGALYVVTMLSGVMLSVGGVNVLFIVFIKEVLGLEIAGLGALESSQGFGTIVGSLVLGHLGARISRRSLTLGSLYGIFVLLVLFSLNRFVPLSFLLIGLIGFSVAFLTVPATTMLQELVPDDLRGRVFGVQGTLTEGAAVASIAIETFLADRFGVVTVLLGAALGGLLWATILMSMRTFKSLEEDAP